MIASENVPAYIVMLDSVRSEIFGETIAILQTIRAFHPSTPIALVCNRQDHPMAWSAEDIRLGLGIPNDILVKPCVSTNMQSVKEIVIDLLYAIWKA
jgi:signal recognition particle receptor subunit beta